MYQVIPEGVLDLMGGKTKVEISRQLEMSKTHVINILNGRRTVPKTTAMAFVFLRGGGKVKDYFKKV